MADPRRDLPSVSALLESAAVGRLMAQAPRAVVVDAVRDAVARARRDPAAAPQGADEWAAAIGSALAARARASLRPLYNATGVVLHTNLGRAPLARVAIDAIAATAAGYSNLEYDVEHGTRGSRYTHCVSLLTELTGAEDAIVVNNCASALVLALNTLADGKATIVSRGELIEIGGSFRVPDIMAKSGSRLVEVGTTNRTHVRDYEARIGPETGALLKVHRSNFAIDGFVSEASLGELAKVAGARDLPLLHDFGSGLMMPLDAYGLAGEPTAADAIRAGATLVMMSGDKLLGGPQAGIIVGAAPAVAAARKNPLARALRVDKLTLAALEATLALYRDPAAAVREIPALAMLTAPAVLIRARAESATARLAAAGVAAEVIESEAAVGGGAFPIARIPSAAIALTGDADAVERRLRVGDPAIIGRIVDGRCVLDLRSVSATDDTAFVEAIVRALA
jgi:L-seryl-tRNA(Ser) seleniumtransferase